MKPAIKAKEHTLVYITIVRLRSVCVSASASVLAQHFHPETTTYVRQAKAANLLPLAADCHPIVSRASETAILTTY